MILTQIRKKQEKLKTFILICRIMMQVDQKKAPLQPDINYARRPQKFCPTSYIYCCWVLASSGFAAIGCFRASPYGGIYILKNFSKLTAKKSANFFFSKIQNFFCLKPSPDQDGTNKKRIFQIGPSVPEEIGFKQTNIDLSAIYKGYIYII